MKGSAKLGVLRHRQFGWFFASGVTNTLGSMMTPIALAFAVLSIDNSAGALAKVLAVEMTANIIFVLFGGVISDRLPRRLVLQTCRIAMAVVLGTLAAHLLQAGAQVLQRGGEFVDHLRDEAHVVVLTRHQSSSSAISSSTAPVAS